MNFLARTGIAFAIIVLPFIAGADDRCAEYQVAAQDNELTRVQEFLDQGIAVDCKDPLTNETAPMRAAINGSVETVKLLLNRGAKVNERTNSGTALTQVMRAEKALTQAGKNFAPLLERQRTVIQILKDAGGVE